ncbi:MAG TPA: ATP-binding protein [Actinomycetales bacterium]|nr:ATP-binding protein [Actinomycetales bacterium]
MAPQAGLFEIPKGARQTRARVVLLTGPSGSGKTWLARRVGLPVLNLDDFYFDHDHPGLPHRHGIVDWDSPETWNSAAAMDAIVTLARTGATDVPIYDIPTSSRTGTTRLDLADSPIFVAEGIFAAELVEEARAEDVMADAICIVRPRATTFFYRLSRDLGEARKPPLTLIRRGLAHAREEPKKIAHDVELGCQPLTFSEAEQVVRAHLRQALLVRGT